MLQDLRAQGQQIDDAGSAQQWWITSVWLAVVVACVYILLAKLSLALLTPEGVAVFWPAAGFAAGMLIAFGPSARWAVAIGTMVATILANLLGDRNIPSSVVFALCNAGEALLAAGLIERYFGSPFNLDSLRNVLGFLGAAIVAAAASGIGGAIGFTLFHDSAASIYVTWQNWFASDGLGIVTVAPLVIGLASAVRRPPPRNETIEGVGALASLIVISVMVIALPQASWAAVVPIALLFPVLLWIAARCRPVFAAAAVFIVTIAIVWTTTIGFGHFGNPALPMADRVLTARAGILAVALCAYVLAALFAERRTQAAALAEGEARLQEALTAGSVATFVWDVRADTPQRSANAPQILGFDPQKTFSSNDFLARIHPDDRERFKSLVHGVRPDRPDYSATFRFKRADGGDIWLEETAKAEFSATGHLVRIKGLTIDASARKRSEDQLGLHASTLDQLLARFMTAAKGTYQAQSAPEDCVRMLQGRVQSIADTHALLSRNRGTGVDLAELIRRQLAPFTTDATAIIGGPNVTLDEPASQTLAMVLHELASNAAKYGALLSPHGRVEVKWTCPLEDNVPTLSITWREVGGPAVGASPQYRYGASVIRDLVPRELAGSADLAFAPTGVCCAIKFPLKTAAARPPPR
jgi:PAS domain S-box-containing protein